MKMMRIISPQFHEAIMKLSNQELPLASAKEVLSMLRTVQEVSNTYHETRIEYMSKLAEKGEDGKPKLDENENFVFPKENLEKVSNKVREMMDKEVELPTIPVKDLGDAKLTAQEYSLLEGLFT